MRRFVWKKNHIKKVDSIGPEKSGKPQPKPKRYVHPILQSQHTIGNRAVLRMLRSQEPDTIRAGAGAGQAWTDGNRTSVMKSDDETSTAQVSGSTDQAVEKNDTKKEESQQTATNSGAAATSADKTAAGAVPKEVIDHLKLREGWREAVYLDSLGLPTVGLGHLLTGTDKTNYKVGDKVPVDILEAWAQADVKKAYDAGAAQASTLGISDPSFINAMASVNFQLGTHWNSIHKKTWAHMVAHDWEKAALEAQDSSWYKQTPVRVQDFQAALRALSGTGATAKTIETASADSSSGAFEFKIGAPTGQGAATAKSLNVRKGPGPGHDTTSKALQKGASVVIYGQLNGWYCIGDGQWVSGQFISIEKQEAGGKKETTTPVKPTQPIKKATPAPSKPGISGAAKTMQLDGRLSAFVADLKKDPTYGSKVTVKSTIRDPESDARAVLNNQRKNAEYYKIFSANWKAAILAAIDGLDLQVATDFKVAVSKLAAWIVEDPKVSRHGTGKAVDFGLAGGDKDFKNFVKTEAEKRGFYFGDETKYNHYHVQTKD